MKLPEPVGYLHRGNGGGYFRYDTGGRLKAVYATAAGEHPLFTEAQLRAEIERRDAVLRMALEALKDGELFDIADAIREIEEVLG